MKKFSLYIAFVLLLLKEAFVSSVVMSGITDFRKNKSTLNGSNLEKKEIVEGINTDKVKVSKENHIHKMSIANKPCITVRDGARLVLECWDALEGRSKEYFENKTPYPEIFPNANPATGPIYIEGSLPGDALEIEIHSMRLSKSGFIQLMKNQFVESTDKEYVYIETEVVGRQILYNGRKMPVEPMIGVAGTAGLQEIWCQETGDNGGNMDCRIVKEGSKILLPVFTEGALLALGDIHAVMGDGEVFGQGVEIGAVVEITVKVRKDLKIQRPLIINDDRIACIASNRDILKATDHVKTDMGRFLVEYYGFSSVDAATLIAFYGNLHFCQIVNPQKTVRMEIEKRYMNFFEHKTLHF